MTRRLPLAGTDGARLVRAVPAEVFVNPPERVERYFVSERAEGRPLTAHMLATGVLVYATEEARGEIERLRARAVEVLAAGPEPAPEALTQLRYAAATWLEDAEDVAAADPELCFALLCRAVDAAVAHRFSAARRWQPRSKDLLAALEALDGGLACDVRAFYRTADPAERRTLARGIVERSVGATGFFEWESAAEAVGP